jgi:hypothetical protein
MNATRKITPYPSKISTLVGLAIPKNELEKIRRESSDVFVAMFPIKYAVTLTTKKTGMLVSGTIVSHLELQDYLDMKGYDLFTLDAPSELAKPGEKTELG